MTTIQPKAYSYIRFSSLQQASGQSESRQIKACINYCAENNLALATDADYVFLDRAKSGYKGEHLDVNGQLFRFLALVENGTIESGSFLIVESLDRLSREHVRLALPRFMELLNKGICIVTLVDKKVYTSKYTELDLIISILIMTRAHEESATKSLRVGDAWRVKKEKARTDQTPIGNNAPLWLEYIDGSYRLNKIRSDLIKEIFDFTIKGYGTAAIAKMLNARQIPSFKNATWAVSSLKKILSNRATLGEYQPYTKRDNVREPVGAPIKGYYPSLISESTFYEAQQAIASRRQAGATKQAARFNVWQGIARCLKCLGALHLVNKGVPPKGSVYLHCSNARKGLCKSKAVRLDKSEIVFREILAKFDSWSLVRDSSASINKSIAAIEGRVSLETPKLTQYAELMKETPSKLVAKLAQECERLIQELEAEREELSLMLASETILDKSHFFAKLDLVSFEGRYRANELLKRLNLRVFIDRDATRTTYVISQKSEMLLGAHHDLDGKIRFVAFANALKDRISIQDFDGSIQSAIDTLHAERMSDMISGDWWDDNTLQEKIVEMLSRAEVPIDRGTPAFEQITELLNLERILSTPAMQKWTAEALELIERSTKI